MNKKTWILLLPFVAVLFCMYSNANGSSAAPLHECPGISTALSARSYPVSFSVKKDIPVINKNKIRPKAWDEISFAAMLPPALPVLRKTFYLPLSVFFHRDAHVVKTSVCCESLRGPPAFVI